MAYSFEEIMEYHPGNKDVYSEIKENLSNLVPFVGAGLTRFAYFSWKDALTELAGKITKRKDSSQVKKLIKSGHYMDAAQQLEKLRKPSNLARDIAHLFSSDHLADKKSMLPKEAVSLLPWLFKGLVLTTNFDETLETVYRECGYPFQTVSHPGHPVLEQFIKNQNHCGLFKMHGTVSGSLIEYENIVFTSEQYNCHYGISSPLIRDLKACFEKRLMFFLGCSLEKDRTMDILQDAIIQGVNHYAIIGCRKSEKDEKVRKLGEKYIRVILYEQGRYEAVRVILEHLLEETSPDLYQKIPHVGALKRFEPSDRFYYNAGIVPLSGRKKELEELNSFLRTPYIPFQWWAITGPGGCGKSRLAYEFQNQLPHDWLARYLKQSDYKNLHGMTASLTQKTLLIADYVQEHAMELGEWMESLNEQPRSLPIRLLLVEREADGESEHSAWTKQLYNGVHNEIKLKETCYRKTFLSLSPLSDQDLMDIMENYAAALQRDQRVAGRVLTDKNRQMLLQKLKAVDPDLCRPLYAMFLADAYVGSNDIEQWKREDILGYVINRERKRLKFSIKSVMHAEMMDEKLYNACVYLQCAATTLQDISVENLQELFPHIWKIIEDKSEYFESPEDFLYQIGLAVKDELPALRPDIVGEYFVYDWLFQNHEKTIRDFIFNVWKTPTPTVIFFLRLLDDFSNLLNEVPERWNILLVDSVQFPENFKYFYLILVVKATFYCNITVRCEEMVDLLEGFFISYPDDLEIAVAFAKGLINLSSKQDEQGAERSAVRLEGLFAKHPDASEIAVAFAKCLVNLSSKQDEQGVERTMVRLEGLCAKYPDVPEIKAAFARCLSNLSAKQDGQGAERTTVHLEGMCARYPDVPEIAAAFAGCLVNLSLQQDGQSAERTAARLEGLCAKYPDVPEIAAAFAKCLSNLSAKQDEQGVEKTAARLEKLCDEYPNVSEIVVFFADCLLSLSRKQDEQGMEKTAIRLEKLCDEYPNVSEIVVFFADCLINLSSKQDEQGTERTAIRLEKLCDKYPDVPNIASRFAGCLVNLSAKQDEQSAERIAVRLEGLRAKYPDVPEITSAFAYCLSNLSAKQDEQSAERIAVRLEELCAKYPYDLDIVVAFARCLNSLSKKQDEQGAEKTVVRLEGLYAKYPDDLDIVVAFARCLSNLSSKQDEQDAEGTVIRLEKLCDRNPYNLVIAAVLAECLINLGNRQDDQAVKKTIKRLKVLLNKHPYLYSYFWGPEIFITTK